MSAHPAVGGLARALGGGVPHARWRASCAPVAGGCVHDGDGPAAMAPPEPEQRSQRRLVTSATMGASQEADTTLPLSLIARPARFDGSARGSSGGAANPTWAVVAPSLLPPMADPVEAVERRIWLGRGVVPFLVPLAVDLVEAPRAVDPVEGVGTTVHNGRNKLTGGLRNRLTSRTWAFYLIFNPLIEVGNQLPPLWLD